MFQSVKWNWGILALCGLLTAVFFNNCQPIATPVSQSNNSSTDLPGGGGGGGGGGPTPTTPPPNRNFFEVQVAGQFRTLGCAGCHTALPKDVVPGGTLATPLIFDYLTMKSRVEAGTTSTNNSAYQRIRSTTSFPHTGGDACPLDINGTVSPCKELKAWTLLEFPAKADGVVGDIYEISVRGDIVGWAIDSKNPAAAVNVLIYEGNTAVGGGTLVATVPANLPGQGPQNGHVFKFKLPNTYRNGVVRNYYFYAIDASAINLFTPQPKQAAAFIERGAGDFYNANVAPRLTTCAPCHAWDYDTAYYTMAVPSPLLGPTPGTSTNNTLINNMSGMDHGGPSYCGGNKANEPCASIRDWWLREFGTR